MMFVRYECARTERDEIRNGFYGFCPGDTRHVTSPVVVATLTGVRAQKHIDCSPAHKLSVVVVRIHVFTNGVFDSFVVYGFFYGYRIRAFPVEENIMENLHRFRISLGSFYEMCIRTERNTKN
jgi:hypothetical protein